MDKRIIWTPAFVLVLFALVMCAHGCGSFGLSREQQNIASYQAMGETLNSSKVTMQTMCTNGTMSQEDCSAAQTAYNQAVDIYKSLGDLSITAIDSGDDTQYQATSKRLMGLLTVIQNIIGDN